MGENLASSKGILSYRESECPVFDSGERVSIKIAPSGAHHDSGFPVHLGLCEGPLCACGLWMIPWGAAGSSNDHVLCSGAELHLSPWILLPFRQGWKCWYRNLCRDTNSTSEGITWCQRCASSLNRVLWQKRGNIHRWNTKNAWENRKSRRVQQKIANHLFKPEKESSSEEAVCNFGDQGWAFSVCEFLNISKSCILETLYLYIVAHCLWVCLKYLFPLNYKTSRQWRKT